MRPPAHYFLPRVGFLIDAVAAGFLVQTDASVGILDFYISNPHSEKKARDKALDLITDALLIVAVANDMKSIICNTSIDDVGLRAEKHGFKKIADVSTFAKEL